MFITDYLKKECIRTALNSKNKEEIIKELLDLIAINYRGIDREKTLNAVLERENIESTSIGNGIAIPHARIDNCQDICVCIGLLQNGMDLNSIDGKLVKIVFLILFPENKINLQLRFLARIARLLHDSTLSNALLECTSPEDIIHTFTDYENRHFH